jgi:hypothetical protein
MFASCLQKSVGPFAMIAGPRACLFAHIDGSKRPLFASPRHTVCKPLHLGLEEVVEMRNNEYG